MIPPLIKAEEYVIPSGNRIKKFVYEDGTIHYHFNSRSFVTMITESEYNALLPLGKKVEE